MWGHLGDHYAGGIAPAEVLRQVCGMLKKPGGQLVCNRGRKMRLERQLGTTGTTRTLASILREMGRDFPGGPVDRTPCSQCRGSG